MNLKMNQGLKMWAVSWSAFGVSHSTQVLASTKEDAEKKFKDEIRVDSVNVMYGQTFYE